VNGNIFVPANDLRRQWAHNGGRTYGCGVNVAKKNSHHRHMFAHCYVTTSSTKRNTKAHDGFMEEILEVLR
jgi:hypothetical protein